MRLLSAAPHAVGALALAACLSAVMVTALPAGPTTHSVGAQEAPVAVVNLPLALARAGRSSLDAGDPLPNATPTARADAAPTAGPTSPATATATGLPSPTVGPTPVIEIDGAWVRTTHYELLSPSERVDKQELARRMEQFYTQATAYFGAEPAAVVDEGRRLMGKIFTDAEAYRQGLRDDGIAPGVGAAGGYYDPGTETFYLHVQPSRHYTRMLTMHEAAHQLQHLAGGCRSPGWWTEGEAEHLGMHTWNGTTLQTSRQPLISLEDYPRSALSAFEQKGKDFASIVRGESGWSYREAWAIVSFLHDVYPDETAELRGRYCGGEDASAGWRAVFGEPVSATIHERYEGWLQANQQPWTWVWNAFEPWGAHGFHGEAAGTNALAVMKERADEIEVAIEPLSGPLRAGVVVGYYDPHDFVMLRLFADRRLHVIRVTEGFQWHWLERTSAADPEPGALDRMRARVKGDRLLLSVNGQTVHVLEDSRDVQGRFGLNLEGCEIRAHVKP